MNVPRRFLVAGDALRGEAVESAGEELHHAARVLRLEAGERVEAFDGAGSARGAVVEIPAPGRIRLCLLEAVSPREPSRRVSLAVALLDSDAFDLVVRDGCQLGASRFVPLLAARIRPGLAKGALRRLERWQRIAAEAAKQCGRAGIPEVDEPRRLEEIVAGASPTSPVAVLDPAGAPFGSDDDGIGPITLVVGPEGGWTGEERRATEAAGILSWSLGPRILRAETAALAALARLGP